MQSLTEWIKKKILKLNDLLKEGDILTTTKKSNPGGMGASFLRIKFFDRSNIMISKVNAKVVD